MGFQKVGFKTALRASPAVVLLITMLSIAMPAGAIANPVGNITDTAVIGGYESSLLQFTSEGHVLGFSPDGVTIASRDHMVNTEFIGSNAVSPQADTAVPVENKASLASPLNRVTYRSVWDGVTVVYEANPGSIVESTYYLGEAERVDSIRLGYNRPVSIDQQGNLVITYESGNMVESAPVAWQDVDGLRKPITVAYVLYGEREVGFSLGECISGIPVVIDPVLKWNTFLGSSTPSDYGNAIAVDGSGNVYVAGSSSGTWGVSPVRIHQGSSDAFAAKLDKNGGLTWNTFLGGSGYDEGSAIAVDGSGNVYVAGTSSSSWGSPVRIYTVGAARQAFVARLTNLGGLTWNTFLGGSNLVEEGGNYGKAIAVDGGGNNVYVAGFSPATWGVSPVQAFSGYGDAFAARINSASGDLIWNTFLGGSAGDDGRSIAVDGSGNVYVAGFSYATWGTSPVRAFTTGRNNFAARLNSSGGLTWNTFLGSSGTWSDVGIAIAVDDSGNAYVTGCSDASWGTSPVRAFVGGIDSFVARLNGATGGLTWNTFLGGSAGDYGMAIAVDGNGNTYVSGFSGGNWGTPLRPYTVAGVIDAFVAGIDSTGSLVWNTFLGGSDEDRGWAIAADAGSVYVAGISEATWGSPVRSYAAGIDVFAARLSFSRGGDFNNDGTSETACFLNGTWYIDYNGNGAWNGMAGGDKLYTFGNSTMTPVTGDWNNDGTMEIGTFCNGAWYIDYNGNGAWNGTAGGDKLCTFGNGTMRPVSGDWNADGRTETGTYLNGTWYLDNDGNGAWNGTVTDRQCTFGNSAMIPVGGSAY